MSTVESLLGFLLAPLRFLAFGLLGLAAVRDDEADALVTAVGDRDGVADGGLGAGFFPAL